MPSVRARRPRRTGVGAGIRIIADHQRTRAERGAHGEPLIVAPPEYVIVRKLEYFREGGSEKHLRDIRSMLAISAELIQRVDLERWISERGLEEQWKRAQEGPR